MSYSKTMDTLCWFCRNAVPRTDKQNRYICGCPWSLHRVPVEGWDAAIDWKRGYIGFSYTVRFCPQYENDGEPIFENLKNVQATRRLFELNWNKYGVDIFPGYDGFGDVRKWQRIDRSTMTDEEFRTAQTKLKKMRQQQWWNRNKGRMNAKARERYRAKHPGAVRYKMTNGKYGSYNDDPTEYKRKYRAANRAHILDYQRTWREKHKKEGKDDEPKQAE